MSTRVQSSHAFDVLLGGGLGCVGCNLLEPLLLEPLVLTPLLLQPLLLQPLFLRLRRRRQPRLFLGLGRIGSCLPVGRSFCLGLGRIGSCLPVGRSYCLGLGRVGCSLPVGRSFCLGLGRVGSCLPVGRSYCLGLGRVGCSLPLRRSVCLKLRRSVCLSFAASVAAFLLVAASAMPFICLSSQLLSALVLLSSQLLRALMLRRATPAAAAASKSVTASITRFPGDAVRSAPPSVVVGRPRKRSANTMLRATATGGGSSFVAADRASTGAAVVDTRLTLKSSRRNGPMAAAGCIGTPSAQYRRSAHAQVSGPPRAQNLHDPRGLPPE